MSNQAKLKAMPLWQSSLLFFIPGAITTLLFTFGFSWLKTLGVGHDSALWFSAMVSFIMLAILATYLYRREGNGFSWHNFKQRMRLKPMDKRSWILTGIAYLVVVGAYVGLLFTAQWYKDNFGVAEWYLIPEDAPVMTGMYGLILLRVVLVVTNVLSEELLWRGYILPRQELAHGKHTWWIHGCQWTGYHMFKPWEFLMLLPGCLAYGWVCTKTQNTTPGIILHFGLNGLGIVMVTLAVFGVIS